MTTIAPAMWADAAIVSHPSIDALRRVGLLGAAELPASLPRDLSRAHHVWGLTLADSRRVIVKSGVLAGTEPTFAHRAADATFVEASLGAEPFVYRMANWCGALGAALPTVIVVDEEAALLVLDDVSATGDAVPLANLLDGGSAALPVFAALGSRIGAIHRATSHLPIPPTRRPLVLDVLRDCADDRRGRRSRVLPRLAAIPALVEAATEASKPGRLCLVHHDLKWDNIALSAAAPVSPVILDWELAGAGDPAWDLGCLLAEHLRRAAEPDASMDAAATAMLVGYRRSARVSARIVALFARRVALAAALRIAQLALEVVERAMPGDDDRAAELVELSAAHAAHASARAREVARWLSP